MIHKRERATDPRKRRVGRRPGRSGRPKRILSTHLPDESHQKLRAIVRARGITVFRFLQDALLTALAGINPDEYARIESKEIFPATGLSPQREQAISIAGNSPRLRERDAHERHAKRPPPTGRDRPSNFS